MWIHQRFVVSLRIPRSHIRPLFPSPTMSVNPPHSTQFSLDPEDLYAWATAEERCWDGLPAVNCSRRVGKNAVDNGLLRFTKVEWSTTSQTYKGRTFG